MAESKQHCQTCDEWVDKVKYNDALDQDQCKWCMEEFKWYSFEHMKKVNQTINETWTS